MARALSMLILLLGLAGCAVAPMLSAPCAPRTAWFQSMDGVSEQPVCDRRSAPFELAAALGSVRQTGGQTRTLGVPRGFLVAMLVLILLVSLA